MVDEWLWVGKPLRPPFRDGSTVLVRHLAVYLPVNFHVTYFGDPDDPVRPHEGTVLDAPAQSYAPTLRQKAGMLSPLLSGPHRHKGAHFFFTPNATTSRVVDLLRRFRGGPCVQSVMSAHDIERHVKLLRPLDAVVVLSEHTRERLVDAGLDGSRVHRIYPGVEIPGTLAEEPRDTVLFAGDLDEQVGDRLVAIARALPEPFRLTIAARPKGEDDAAVRARLQEDLAELLERGRVEVLAEVSDLRERMDRATLQVFVADHVRKKVDLPLVLLEGMARGVPVICCAGVPSVEEIFSAAREAGVVVGAAVAPGEIGEAVREALLGGETAPWGEAARALAEARFSAEAMASAHAAVYTALRS